MPRHPTANTRKAAAAEPELAAAAEPTPPVKRVRKPRAAAAEAVEPQPAAAEPVKAIAPRARKPPTEAQLANRKRFAEQVARCKQLRAADPKLTQREARALAMAK